MSGSKIVIVVLILIGLVFAVGIGLGARRDDNQTLNLNADWLKTLNSRLVVTRPVTLDQVRLVPGAPPDCLQPGGLKSSVGGVCTFMVQRPAGASVGKLSLRLSAGESVEVSLQQPDAPTQTQTLTSAAPTFNMDLFAETAALSVLQCKAQGGSCLLSLTQ